MDDPLAFIPGMAGGDTLPLSRFLPPLAPGIIQSWLKANVPAGAYILDPICATPTLALEAARAGYRVLVASNNPILSFMLEVLASAPSKQDFQAALSDLASSRRGEERLEVHLQSLYTTECESCGRKIQAQAYFWKKGELQPYAKIYRCPYCGEEGEHAITSFDLDRLATPGNASLHRARALERVSQPGDSLREGVEEALQVYLIRPIYFLFTLINKIEGLPLSAEKRRLLTALALTVCDEANSLWPHPSGRLRPRQLSTPPQFRENNLWLALENAVQTWSCQPQAVPFSTWPWPEVPAGGIALFQGRLKSMLPLANGIVPAAAVAVFPRPNQAYWTLSALWSGWLWGKEAVKPLRSALERRRYDWHWHAAALYHALNPLNTFSQPPLPVFGLIPEIVPGFFSAAVIAAESAGLHLRQAAFQPDDELVELIWNVEGSENSGGSPATWEAITEKAGLDYLKDRFEPAPYLHLHIAALSGLAAASALPQKQTQFDDEIITRVQASVQKALSTSGKFIRYDSRPQNPESGLWWFANSPQPPNLPLADRVEMEIVRYLQKNPGHTQIELVESLSKTFPGLMTPSDEVVKICLESYGDVSSSLPERWQLRPQEYPPTRRSDLAAVRAGLDALAAQFGFSTEGENPVLFKDSNGSVASGFYLLASGIISKYVLNPPLVPAERCIIVLPGSRANLVAYKIRHDPRLADAMASGWRFLKFRLLRQMLDRTNLTYELFDELLSSDPPRWEGESTQMSFFPAL